MIWDDLRIIAAVRDSGTYAGAAKALGIDETTVARRLARIQKSLGNVLFDAVDGLRRPTAYCTTTLAHIDEMARQVANIKSEGLHQHGLTGNVRVTVTPSIAEILLAPTMGEFLGSNPGLSLELDTSNDNVNFSRWEADLAIRLGKPEKGAFIVRKLTDLRLYLFRPERAQDTSGDPFTCAYPDELGATPEMKELEAMGLTDGTRLKTSNMSLIRTALLSYNAIGILPEYFVQDLLIDENLSATELGSCREVWLLIQPHLKSDAATRAVIEWINSSFASANASRGNL